MSFRQKPTQDIAGSTQFQIYVLASAPANPSHRLNVANRLNRFNLFMK